MTRGSTEAGTHMDANLIASFPRAYLSSGLETTSRPPPRNCKRKFAAKASLESHIHPAPPSTSSLPYVSTRPQNSASVPGNSCSTELVVMPADIERPRKRATTVARVAENSCFTELEVMGTYELKDLQENKEFEEAISDIDSQDWTNPLAVIDYVKEIHDFYWSSEDLSCANPSYMLNQSDISERMRAILIDWLVEVHHKLELLDETLFLTVNLIDRYLALQNVTRKKLKLVGIAALLLACKYVEVKVTIPTVEDLIEICVCAYTRAELLEMDSLMFNTLQFNMSVPTPYVFMKRFLKAAKSDKKLELLSFFLMELCLVEYKMLQFKPSMLAAAAVFTAQCTLKGFQFWSKCTELHSRYSQEQLIECAILIVELHQKAGQGKLTAVHRKFGTTSFGYASKCEPARFLMDTTRNAATVERQRQSLDNPLPVLENVQKTQDYCKSEDIVMEDVNEEHVEEATPEQPSFSIGDVVAYEKVDNEVEQMDWEYSYDGAILGSEDPTDQDICHMSTPKEVAPKGWAEEA